MPFKSKAQHGWMYANEPEMAKKWEKETPKGKKLPKKVKKNATSESIDKIIATALAEAETKRRRRSLQPKSSPSDMPSFYMSSSSSHPWHSDSPRRYIATGISADYRGDAGGCLDVDLISTLSQKFTKYAIEYATKHGYEIVPDENGSLRGDYCSGQLTWPIKRPDKARQEHFESRLDSALNESTTMITVAGLAALGLFKPELARFEKWWKGKSLKEIKRELETKEKIDKQAYARYPKGKKINKAVADKITKIYKNQNISHLNPPLDGPDANGMYVIK